MSQEAPAKVRKMYIDIDGVLVVWDQRHCCIELSRGFGRLMRFCKIHDIKPYWLTMWALFPGSLDGINCLLWPKSCPTMAHPEPLVYDRALGKASMVDFDSDFVWIEDGLGEKDLAALAARGCQDRFYWTDGQDPDCLIKFIEFTRQRLALPEHDEWKSDWDTMWTKPRDRNSTSYYGIKP